MTITVFLLKALICFNGHCYHALVGKNTPIGTYQLQYAKTDWKGYGGDVLIFKQNSDYVWAVHRTWLGNPLENRQQRIRNNNPNDRIITHGCINVEPEIFLELKKCCSKSKLVIEN